MKTDWQGMMVKSTYHVIVYTNRQLHNIKEFCCRKDDTVPLATDTTYNLYDLWLTDTYIETKDC